MPHSQGHTWWEDHLDSSLPRTRLNAHKAYIGPLLKTNLESSGISWGEVGGSAKELGNSFNEKYSPKVPKCRGL